MNGRYDNRAVTGEDTSTPRSLKPKIVAGVVREAVSGQEKRLEAFGFLTPHASSGVRTQPAVETTITKACVLYSMLLTLSTDEKLLQSILISELLDQGRTQNTCTNRMVFRLVVVKTLKAT